jgi:uncharacterized protein (DUF305 family)
MKAKMLIATIFILALVYNCKSGSKGESDSTGDTAVLEEKSDSAEWEEITGGFMGIKHHSMMQKDTLKLTGDPDYDFAIIMKIHHRHGIAMANEEVKYGSDTAMRSLAGRIKESQEKELKEIQDFISQNSPGNNDAAFLSQMQNSMKKAKDEMNKSTSMSGNFDRYFSSLMALHHRHGLDLAQAEVKFGKNAAMKKMAQQMIKQRNLEIKQLQGK